ncbi:MAG: hypothetical protein CSA45_05005 [Gammaproteobacteria bacterium]|nr:MAG: hypothetical protein CSA45_05005 [Gammaproteobacteria bacterium]
MNTIKIARWAAVIALLLSIALVLAYILSRDRPLGEGYRLASDYGGEFTLQSDRGEVSLSDFRGKVVIVYFGFMNCQDACPISMAKMRKALNRLTEEELASLQVFFVSIDPKRDTPEDLAAFTKNYHKNVMGLVDDAEIVNNLVAQYGGVADMSILDGKSAVYDVEHSSRFYMVDKQGKLQTTMSHSTTPAELVAKIRLMLKEPYPGTESNTELNTNGSAGAN